MSMPRDALSGHGHARFVGRVGALAVALGIGAAIANSPGLASADPNDSDSAGSSPSSSASSAPGSDSKAGATPSANESAGEQSVHTTGTDPEPAADDTSTDGSATEQDPGTASESVPGDESQDPKPNKPHRKVQSKTAAHSAGSEESAGATDSPKSDAAVAATADAPPVHVRAASSTQAEIMPTATLLSTAPTAAAPAAGAPASVVTQVVSSLLSVVGLNPQATGGSPAAPPQSPTLWAMLGFVRRELGHVFAPATATAASTVDTSAPVQRSAALSATSPLGTQQQLTAEQLATRTLNTLPVQLMKLVLRFGFMSAAQQQFSLVGGPDQANIDQLDAAVNEYAMGAAFQQQILDSMNPTVVMQVAPPHTWYGQVVPGSRILYDNPDTIYRFMGVNGASSYVITGRFDGDMPADTTFSVLTGLTGTTARVLTKDELVFGPDGRSFTITADSTPANGRPNHLQLTAETTLIATRNTLSDWNNEEPMSLEITRVGGPPRSLFSQLGGFAIPGLGPAVVNNPLLTTLVSLVPPLPFNPPILRGTVAAVIMALGIQRESTYMAVATTDPETGERLQPNVLKDPTRNAEFLATQLQSAGYFQLADGEQPADDEVLVVTIDPGSAGYFVLPVTNDWTITNDYWNQQTSLNNSQALQDENLPTYTFVISKNDPGVANWVSTGGLNQGSISMRFQDLASDSDLPTASSQVVKLGELSTVLPAGTVFYDSTERALQLAERKAGFDKRFAPYPQP